MSNLFRRFLGREPREGSGSAPWATDRVSQDELATRELRIGADALARGKDPYAAIAADRAARWAQWLHQMQVIPQELYEWAARMQGAHGPTVVVGRMELPWLVALLVVRYGESEHWWPAEFQAEDLARAHRWEAGEIPARVAFAHRQIQAAGEVSRP